MYRQNQPPNIYGQGSPHHVGDPGFRSPMMRPRYQSSPRFHQPAVPHYTGPGRPGPSGPDFSPGHGPPGRSPPYRSPRPDYSFNSPMHSSFEGSSPYHTPGYGRGNGRGRGRGQNDYNPGGSDDINMYYNPNMMRDPWEGLQPVPTSKGVSNTT